MWPTRQLYGHTISTLASVSTTEVKHVYFTQAVHIGTGAGLILPSYYEKVFSFFGNRGEPLIETPKRASRNLYAVDWDCEIFELYLDELQPEPPGPMTIREYAKRYFGDEQGYLDAYCCERDGIDKIPAALFILEQQTTSRRRGDREPTLLPTNRSGPSRVRH